MEFVSYGQVLNAFGDPMAWGTYMLRSSFVSVIIRFLVKARAQPL
jgi:hypothetical protein